MGSNRLIQQGAKLVMDASDILDDLQILLPESKPIAAATRPLPELSESERSVYEAIEASETAIEVFAGQCLTSLFNSDAKERKRPSDSQVASSRDWHRWPFRSLQIAS